MIVNHQREVRVRVAPLERFLRRVRRRWNLGPDALAVCLVSGAKMTRWNGAYRGKPRPTDVLSFPGSDGVSRRVGTGRGGNGRSRQRPYLGDIAIAPRVARRNARAAGHSLDTELRVLLLHGVLHLLGYDHETDRGEMDRVEHRLRREFRLPAPGTTAASGKTKAG